MVGGQHFEGFLFPTEVWKEQMRSSAENRTATDHNFVHREILFGSRAIVQDSKYYFTIFMLMLTVKQELLFVLNIPFIGLVF